MSELEDVLLTGKVKRPSPSPPTGTPPPLPSARVISSSSPSRSARERFLGEAIRGVEELI